MVYLLKLTTKCFLQHTKPQTFQRSISALYVTGDKATKNYAPLQPYMDFEETFKDTKQLEESIKARGLSINLNELKDKYTKYKIVHEQMQKLEIDRDLVYKKVKEANQSGVATKEEIEAMKTKGMQLRNDLKALKAQKYPIEEDFIYSFLNLPNILHADCPIKNIEKLMYRSRTPRCEEERPSHLSFTDLIRFHTNDRYYMLGAPAEFDIFSTQAMANYFVEKGGFMQTSNPDFVRLVILEASGTPLETHHLVKEKDLASEINRAYLTGGATFEGFLGAFARLVVYPTVLPLPCVVAGRRYEKVKGAKDQPANLFTATQTNAVQTFVATKTAEQANEYLDKILNLAVDFYKELGVHFRIVYVDASALTIAECLRANIEMYSPAEKRYICVGSVSNYSDYVSKRIMFCIREKKDYAFPHLVGGPVLYTTRLIAVLLENGVKLEDCKLLGDSAIGGEVPNKATNEFKDLFK
ncbi:serine--tRNA synthetase-like protein Slimp [Eurosta solidaginis]|uniref:serine--tRNA synthetase-like protein Slimp n=1 Tax=Eurosta solidaginis TaxID=178769 RepID=UPI003530E5F8